ncbi:hypothetical protein [Cyclobacterium xiamenense]|uniref:hypothetical protein n=1 Tax=Cyclobacterium xiamenense TaxID=1297121 RepID=UPI0035D0A9B5
MLNIPLYRGDSDKYSTRNLRTTAPHGYLMTNLNKGGEGRIIDEKPLIDLINRHVDEGWNTTHFLSFSEDENTAFRFGMHTQLNQVIEKRQNYVEVSWDNGWEFVITRINTINLEAKELSPGVYEGKYKTTNPLYAKVLPISRLIIIDVAKFLLGLTGFDKSKLNSSTDKEWLILPANPIKFVNRIEYSSILDGGCIDEIRFYASIENVLNTSYE